MMLSSSLRQGRSHLRHIFRPRRPTGVVLARTYAKSNNFIKANPILRSRVIINSLPSFGTNSASLMQNQHAYFSTEGGIEQSKLRLLVDPAEDLPEIYASPSALLKEFTQNVVPLESGCKSILLNKGGNDEQWHTAAYVSLDNREYFYSGKFGEFVKNPSFSSEDTCIVDGRVYYHSKDVAKEAAAARSLDCIAFRQKYAKSNYLTFDQKGPIRYCVELPYIFPMAGEGDISKEMVKNAHAPSYYWKCLMQGKYGPVEAKFDLHCTTFDCETATGSVEETWYSATCFEPKTGEAFDSGVFGVGFTGKSVMPDAPLTSLPLEEIKIKDRRVYYRDESTAKHAAAARAIDCMNLRMAGVKANISQLCLDEPYFTINDKGQMQQTDYEELKAIVDERRTVETGFCWLDYVGSKVKKSSRNHRVGPSIIVQDAVYQMYRDLIYDKGKRRCPLGKQYNITSLEEDDGVWYTSTFTDPVTKEVFPSGIPRVPENPEPYGLASVRILDGKVYFNNLSSATNASAARALDCYIHRDKTHKEFSLQLCYEDPYDTTEEGASMMVDYEAISAQREEDILNVKEARTGETDLFGNENNETVTPSIKGDNFSSYARSHPYLLHVPKTFLNNAFQSKIGDSHFDIQRKVDEEWYTATFTDPITKEKFSSGLGQDIGSVQRRPGATPAVPLHLAQAKYIDGKIYYRVKKLAEHAAAARALDCYFLREGTGYNNVRLCMEEPYKTAEEGTSQEIDYDDLFAQRSFFSDVDNQGSAPINLEKRSTFSAFVNANSFLLHSPKNLLSGAFRKIYRYHLPGGSYEVKHKRHDNETWSTAIFTDPITKEQFSSGLGKDIGSVERRKDASLTTPLHLAETKTFDGIVHYRLAKYAEHAAAARALDCYIFREGFVNNGVRLCIEEPYECGVERDVQQVDHDAVSNERIMIGSKEHGMSKIESSNDDFPSLALSFAEESAANIGNKESFAKVGNTLSTMGRIAEIFTDSSNTNSSGGASFPWQVNSTEEWKSAESPSAKIESILEWYERVNNDPQNYGDAYALAKLCNKILSALGNTNHALELNEEDSYINVEEKAKAILDKIVSLSITFDAMSDPTFIAADTFNAYMQCLDRLDPIRSAESAQDLLHRMAKRDKFGHTYLPPPNVGTYNVVMSLWSMVDGIDGQNGANNIYSLLESASLSGGGEHYLQPNTETFKILLGVNSKVDGKFSLEQAQIWLSKLEQISASVCGKKLIPDADLYNAALTSKSEKISTKPSNARYARTWLKHGAQYDGGFKLSDVELNREVTDIKNWLLYAEKCRVNPNTDMYEAVIQAYTKTGTKKALIDAEEWAKRAINSTAPTRLATFHPIIASWALCQFERAPARVKEWTTQLEALSKTKPHLRPDLSTLSAQIVAWRNVQAGLMARLENSVKSSPKDSTINSSSIDGGIPRDLETIFAAAQNCTQYLGEIHSNWNKLDSVKDVMAMAMMLTLTAEAWGCASRFALLHPTSSVSLDTSHGVHELLRLARMFDAKIDDDRTDEEQVQSILHLMGEGFAEIVSQLHQIDSLIVDPEDGMVGKSYFFDEIPEVERMLRDYEFYSRKHFSPGNFTFENVSLRHKLYKEILRGCAGVKRPADYGHCTRLCKLIMDHLSWQDDQCHNIGDGSSKEDITDVYVDIALLMGNVVTSEHEKMYALTTVYNNANRFFETKKWFNGSNYATVDQARLIGAMRMAMGDSELTEPFLSRFDKQPPRNEAQGNTAMAFVEELLKK